MFRLLGASAIAVAAVTALAGCSAAISTTDTAADALHTVAHGVSVSSRATTNLSDNPDASREAEARAFVTSQRVALRREAAAGGGEHIQTLARLIGADKPVAVGPWMQAHYAELFAPDMTAARFVDAVQARVG